MAGYTVIDFETTGFSPAKHHRVVEIGVVQVSPTGEIQDEWASLINPGRDISNSHVHGITASDVVSAPAFADILPRLLPDVAGRTIVAHNAPFDLRFLSAEMQRAGLPLAAQPITGLCTMQWSGTFLDLPSRRLADCCAACGVSLSDAHSAGADAHATAELLAHFLGMLDGSEKPWQMILDEASLYPWPVLRAPRSTARILQRQDARTVSPAGWLERIVSRMPRSADARVDSYFGTLELALLDGILAEHEKDELVAVAHELGLSRSRVLELHAVYLWALAETALEDGIVTEQEHADLRSVAAVLGLCEADVAQALRDASTRRPGKRAAAREKVGTAGITLEPGDRIVFTGAMRRSRQEWEDVARERGLVPGAVTKKTKLVVAADPNSQSGKAAKARSYGVPIISEAAWERILGA